MDLLIVGQMAPLLITSLYCLLKTKQNGSTDSSESPSNALVHNVIWHPAALYLNSAHDVKCDSHGQELVVVVFFMQMIPLKIISASKCLH